jgi:hypothetical protein
LMKEGTMTNTEYRHDYRIGEAVLANLNGVLIPGVIEDKQDGKLLIRLSDPWVNETGQPSDEVWLTPDRPDPSIDEETGGNEALPG